MLPDGIIVYLNYPEYLVIFYFVLVTIVFNIVYFATIGEYLNDLVFHVLGEGVSTGKQCVRHCVLGHPLKPGVVLSTLCGNRIQEESSTKIGLNGNMILFNLKTYKLIRVMFKSVIISEYM